MSHTFNSANRGLCHTFHLNPHGKLENIPIHEKSPFFSCWKNLFNHHFFVETTGFQDPGRTWVGRFTELLEASKPRPWKTAWLDRPTSVGDLKWRLTMGNHGQTRGKILGSNMIWLILTMRNCDFFVEIWHSNNGEIVFGISSGKTVGNAWDRSKMGMMNSEGWFGAFFNGKHGPAHVQLGWCQDHPNWGYSNWGTTPSAKSNTSATWWKNYKNHQVSM